MTGRVVLDTAYVTSALPALRLFSARIAADPNLVNDDFSSQIVMVLKVCACALCLMTKLSRGVRPVWHTRVCVSRACCGFCGRGLNMPLARRVESRPARSRAALQSLASWITAASGDDASPRQRQHLLRDRGMIPVRPRARMCECVCVGGIGGALIVACWMLWCFAWCAR